MNKIWQQLAIATNWPILVAVAVLSTMGVLSIWADSQANVGAALQSDHKRQIAFLVVGIVCMGAFQAVNYQKIGRYAWGFYIFSFLLIGYTVAGSMVTLPGVPRGGVKGAYNWIRFGSFSLQPAELMKIAFVLVLARYLRFRSNYRTLKGLLAPFALALAPVALILKQPDLGSALIFIPALFAMLFVAGAKIKHLILIVLMGLSLVPIAWFSGDLLLKDYQRKRIRALFSDDARMLQDTGLQQHRALIAIGSGGLAGKGMGNIPIGSRVPESHNDMVFALIGEQFGFFGSAVVLVAYIVLFAAGVEISASTREPFGRLVALGVVSLLAGQTFLNLMVATKLMPVTGITLPFVSYGGSSLLASFMAAGLLLNIGQNRPLVMARESFQFD
jgi:cell division protein FtsW (lipid II flippase)